MQAVRPSAPWLAGVEPYDPKYLPADVRRKIERALRRVPFNRYPDPLATELRDLIAAANGLDREHVLVGNGGDELLFDLALAWGGPGRTFLNTPPTFSVYGYNAMLTNTAVVDVPRRADFSVDEDAVCERLARGDVDFTIVTSPNNPTGNLVSPEFAERMLNASDALVVIDEAYFEFSRFTVRPLLERYENLVILRTFSKAFSLAGVRIGYVLGNAKVIDELTKVRQPYSVDAVSQAIARVVYENRAAFEPGIEAIISERARMFAALQGLEGVEPFPSDSNYILFRIDDAAGVWQRLYDAGVLVRDFSSTKYLENCLRVSIGSREENDRFLAALAAVM